MGAVFPESDKRFAELSGRCEDYGSDNSDHKSKLWNRLFAAPISVLIEAMSCCGLRVCTMMSPGPVKWNTHL